MPRSDVFSLRPVFAGLFLGRRAGRPAALCRRHPYPQSSREDKAVAPALPLRKFPV